MRVDPAINWLSYQQDWIDDESKFKIAMFSRQTGKTFSTSGEIVKSCIDSELKQKRERWVILSRGERQAKEAINECIKPLTKAYFSLLNSELRRKLEPHYSESDYKISEARYKALEVDFPGGSKITAIPANPDTARGFSANVFLDEFAFHQNSRDIWKALFPVVSKPGLKLRVTSTPNGKGNKFYDLWTSNDSIWSRHRVDIHDAVKAGLDRDVEMLRKGCADEEVWRQEYELEFLDELSAWFDYDLIMSCEDENAGKPELYQGGPCFIGNDIARRNDLWVAWVFEKVGDVFWTREIRTLKNASFSEHDQVIDELMRKYRVVKLDMDQTGMGEKPVEDAQNRYGRMTVEGVIMSASRLLTMATAAKQAMQDRKVRLPQGDPVLRADLHKIQKAVGPTGHPRLITNRDSEGHADRAWAGILGIAGGTVVNKKYEYTPAVLAEPDNRWGRVDYDDDYESSNNKIRFGRGAW
jgi:phage FluMu gp28-like protein